MKLRASGLLSVVVSILVASACDKIPLFAPTKSTITLSAAKRTLALNESIQVTALVLKESGAPVQNGTRIRFTTTLGSVAPVEIETTNGAATVTFSAGSNSGTADLTASSGTAGSASADAATLTNVLKFTIGAAATDSISVRANPSSVSPLGGTVDIIATVLGANGTALSGVPVTFTASKGTLSAVSALTNAAGEATVRLTTTVETTVTASAGGKTSTAATVTVLGTPLVTLTCAGTGTAGPSCSQGTDQPVTFTAARGSTTTQISSATLSFGDGTSVALGTLSSSATVTKTYSTAGNRTATVTATDVNGQVTSASVAVAIAARTPLSVTITTGTPTTVPIAGSTWTFTAVVKPDADATTIVSYSWTFGDGSTSTTSGNVTSHVYAGSASNGPKSISVTVTTSDGRTAVGQTQILVSGI